jgi:hypothetical protein
MGPTPLADSDTTLAGSNNENNINIDGGGLAVGSSRLHLKIPFRTMTLKEP